MRPITLTVSAFGPYADETTLHFEDLGMQRLFVITGPTGSGKTTIFEAILYALYGKLSKKGMDPSSLRCDFLRPTDSAVTYVTFAFEVGGKQYRIRRQPKQWVAKKRGEGKKEIGQEVVLECMDHADFLPLTKISEVDAKIVELIGLEEEQFKKIVMLPQGAFQEFLISNTKEKSELLRNIFNTGMYDRVLQKVKSRVSATTDAYERVRVQYQSQCGLLKLESVMDFGEFPSSEEVSCISQTVENEKQTLSLLGEKAHAADKAYKVALDDYNRKKQHNEDVMQWQHAIEKKTILEEQAENVGQKKGRIIEAQKAENIAIKENRYCEEQALIGVQKQDIERMAAYCGKLAAESDIMQIKHFKAQEEKKVADEAFQSVPTLSNKLNLLQQHAKKNASLEKLQAALYDANQRKEKAEQALILLSKKLEESENATKNQQRLQQEKAEKQLEASQLNQTLQEERHRFKLMSMILQREEKLQEYRKQEKQAALSLHEAEAALQVAKTQNRRHTAAFLAEGLEDGVPCPVCGAVHHPNLAFDEGENNEEEKLSKVRDEEQKHYLRIQAVMDQEERLLREELEELSKESDVAVTIEEVRAMKERLTEKGKLSKYRYEELINKLKSLDEQMANEAQTAKMLNDLKVQQGMYQQAYTSVVTEVGLAQGGLQQTIDELKALEAQDDFDCNSNAEGVAQSIETIRTRHEEAERNFGKTQEAHAKLLLEKAAAESTLSEKKASLLSLERTVAALEEDFLEARDAAFSTPAAYLSAKEDVAQMALLQQQVEQYHNEWTQIVTTCDMLEKRVNSQHTVVDLTVLEATCQKLQEELEAANTLLSEHRARHENNIGIVTQLEKLLEIFKGLENDYAVLGKLRDVLDGKNRFNMRFETFAQAYYFESMLEHANERLARMTHGRYSFKRKEAVRDGRKQAGLDLDVMDQYTGRARDVATLSGGESFKASLSLALGLADVVRSESGGVELSTIFIDEGFGTLDDESLDDTVETLLQLQDSGRLVGVISHVAELKERIPAHLVVTSGTRGSHAHFEVNQ